MLLNQGLAAHRVGNLREAEKLYQAALRIDGHLADAHHLLASVLGQQGRHDDALRAVKRALKIHPDHAAFHATAGNLQLAAGQVGRAREAYARCVTLEPKHPGHRFNLALALERLGDYPAAAQEYRECVALSPNDVRANVNLGSVLLRVGRVEEAVEVLNTAVRLDPSLMPAWANLATAHRELGKGELAVDCFRKALELVPDQPQMFVNLAQALRELGKIDEAVEALGRALALAPDMVEARLLLAVTRKNVARDAQVAWIEELARDPAARGVQQYEALFAHAKTLFDLGEGDAAFEVLVRANAARRGMFRYSFDDDAARIRAIREVFTPELVARMRGIGCPDATPIFVVGMPRSGTTLVEQILSSHRDVYGAGEVGYAGEVLDALPGGFPGAMQGATAELLRAAGERYVELLRGRAPEPRPARIVDKMPLNCTRLGGILAMLPNAKVLHCVRDPRDTCLSIFRQNFEHDMGFAFDLAELGRFYRLYQELMEHWRTVLGPDAFLDVRYEEVVADLEGSARRMVDFVGLSWDASCVEFHRAERQVRTASLQQVRKPIYRSSVDAWRRWEAHLGPLLDVLGRA